jgi:enoyl-CoA hydratase/carnithine racemase
MRIDGHPEVKNALNDRTMNELEAVFKALEREPRSFPRLRR